MHGRPLLASSVGGKRDIFRITLLPYFWKNLVNFTLIYCLRSEFMLLY
jgi:hypothetical protein